MPLTHGIKSANIGNIVGRALTGEHRRGPRWAVEGTSRHGERFRIDTYHSRGDALDFAREVIAGGGSAQVRKVPTVNGHNGVVK